MPVTGWQRTMQNKMGEWAKRSLPRLPYLHHTTLHVTEETAAACKEFYTELIGLHEVGTLVDKSIWFKEGIHLYWGVPKLSDPGYIGAHHIALCMGDRYDKVVEACKRWRLFIADGTSYWGSPRCYIRDPANNRIELMKEPPSL